MRTNSTMGWCRNAGRLSLSSQTKNISLTSFLVHNVEKYTTNNDRHYSLHASNIYKNVHLMFIKSLCEKC